MQSEISQFIGHRAGSLLERHRAAGGRGYYHSRAYQHPSLPNSSSGSTPSTRQASHTIRRLSGTQEGRYRRKAANSPTGHAKYYRRMMTPWRTTRGGVRKIDLGRARLSTKETGGVATDEERHRDTRVHCQATPKAADGDGALNDPIPAVAWR